MIRLSIVSHSRLFRECLASALALYEGLAVVDLIGDHNAAAGIIKATQPDIVLLDINLKNGGALGLSAQLNQEVAPTKAIILGVIEEEASVLRCIEAGAKGYVSIEAGTQDVVEVVRCVQRGETVCSPDIAYTIYLKVAELSQRQHKENKLASMKLSQREEEILRLMADGLGNRQIADQLYLSLHTVKNHVHNILKKLQVHHRSEAVGMIKTVGG